MDDPVRPKKPLSSASEIMSRHGKKKRRWFRNLLPGHESSKQLEKRRKTQPDISDVLVSRSLESVGNLNLSVIGFDQKAASYSNLLNQDGDDLSLSSTDSDQPDSLSDSMLLDSRGDNSRKHLLSTNSSDSESSIDFGANPIWQDFKIGAQYERTPAVNIPKEDKFAQSATPADSSFIGIFQNFLPKSWTSASRSSIDSLGSQSEEKKALIHFVNQSESDQVRYNSRLVNGAFLRN